MNFDLINSDPGFISSSVMDYITEPGTYSFIRDDNEEDFEVSLRENPEDWYYRNNPVEYTINSHKFRTKEFKDIDWKNSIVMFGCSYVFGVGVTDEDTIAARLQEITGKYVVNLGSPGLSNGAIAYNSYYLKENYPEPVAVINSWTHMARWSRVNEKKKLINYVYGITRPGTGNPESNISQETINTEVSNNIMYMKMTNALWKDHPNYIQTCIHDCLIDDSTSKIRHFSKRLNDVKPVAIAQKVFPEIIQLDRSWVEDRSGRDNEHWGREVNKKLAKMIASNLKL